MAVPLQRTSWLPRELSDGEFWRCHPFPMTERHFWPGDPRPVWVAGSLPTFARRSVDTERGLGDVEALADRSKMTVRQ